MGEHTILIHIKACPNPDCDSTETPVVKVCGLRKKAMANFERARFVKCPSCGLRGPFVHFPIDKPADYSYAFTVKENVRIAEIQRAVAAWNDLPRPERGGTE